MRRAAFQARAANIGSSEPIGSLAAALAKTQGELTNPENGGPGPSGRASPRLAPPTQLKSNDTRGPQAEPRPSHPRKVLDLKASSDLRDKLLVELSVLKSSDDAALWAKRSLLEKNKLTGRDAQSIEQAFAFLLTRLGAIEISAPRPIEVSTSETTEPSPPRSAERSTSETAEISTPKTVGVSAVAMQDAKRTMRRSRGPGKPRKGQQSEPIDKSVLTLPEPRRIRDRDHVKFVATRPCLICGRQPADAHHLRFAQSRALGKKVSDEFTVPLCRGHHREVHRCGDEATWWTRFGIDPAGVARTLWLETHPLPKQRDARSTKRQGGDAKHANLQNQTNSAAVR